MHYGCIGDFNPECPPEFALLPSLRTAIRMREQYGTEEALRLMTGFRDSYCLGAWGWAGWDFGMRFLERLETSDWVEQEEQEERQEWRAVAAPLPAPKQTPLPSFEDLIRRAKPKGRKSKKDSKPAGPVQMSLFEEN